MFSSTFLLFLCFSLLKEARCQYPHFLKLITRKILFFYAAGILKLVTCPLGCKPQLIEAGSLRTILFKESESLTTQIRFKNNGLDSEGIGDLLRDQYGSHILSQPQPLSLWQSKGEIRKEK